MTATAIYNNTVYGNTEGIFVGNDATSTVVRNNVAYRNNVTNYSNSGSGTTASNNLFGDRSEVRESVSARLPIEHASPAIDAGTSIVPVTTDLTGTRRPQGGASDIGAFEWSASE